MFIAISILPISASANEDGVNVSVSVVEKRSDQTVNDFDFSAVNSSIDNQYSAENIAVHENFWHRFLRVAKKLLSSVTNRLA